MIKIETDDYFRYLCSFIDDEDFRPSQYQVLLSKLHQTPFEWTIEDDSVRALDGLALRDDYALSKGLDLVDMHMANRHPCSMLEMMVALARRCECEIMEDLDFGRRIGRWFKVMLKSLGLRHETDEYYDEGYINFVLDEFLVRAYEPDGDGALFRVENSDKDLRTLSIWSQMHLYLCSLENW